MVKADNDLLDRTKRFALDIIRMFTSLPKTAEAAVLGKQVLRSGTSIGANYREAYRSRSRAEFIAKAGDCLKELEERHIVDEMHMADRRKECDELIAIFVAIINKSKLGSKN